MIEIFLHQFYACLLTSPQAKTPLPPPTTYKIREGGGGVSSRQTFYEKAPNIGNCKPNIDKNASSYCQKHCILLRDLGR